MKKLWLFMLLTACFPLMSNSLNKINVGNSEEDVVMVLGKPFTKKTYRDRTFMVYYVHDSLADIFFSKDKFPYIGFFPLIRTGREYWIITEGNRVVSFGDATNYKNSIPRALNERVIEVEQ